MGVGGGADTENATSNSDTQMTAGTQESAFSVERKGQKEDQENGGKMETRKDICPQCQTVTESYGTQGACWHHRYKSNGCVVTTLLIAEPFTHMGSVNLPGSSLDDLEDTDSTTLNASTVNPDGGCHWRDEEQDLLTLETGGVAPFSFPLLESSRILVNKKKKSIDVSEHIQWYLLHLQPGYPWLACPQLNFC